MSVDGLCEICQSAPAEHRCDRCGTLVCRDHFDGDLSVCLECRAETGAGDEDSHPDVDEYRF